MNTDETTTDMNALARSDLLRARDIIKRLSEADQHPLLHAEITRLLAEAVGRLVNVCAALDADLVVHSNTQDAHNH